MCRPDQLRLWSGRSSAGQWGLFLNEVLFGCFHKLGVLFVGVLIARALLFGVYSRAPDFWKLPFGGGSWYGTCSLLLLLLSSLRHLVYKILP